MNYYFEFNGGLGDILDRIFTTGEYRILEHLSPADRVQISLITMNPFADELFEWHPRRAQLDVRMYPRWWPDQDAARRLRYRLPARSDITPVPQSSEAVKFHPCPSDIRTISGLDDELYIVLAASTGGDLGLFPHQIVSMVCQQATALKVYVVAVGRHYPEPYGGFYCEPQLPKGDYVIDVIDQLSLAGVAKLLEGAGGIICGYTSYWLLARWLKKPALLLYRPEFDERVCVARSAYPFCLDGSATWCASFADCTPALVREFLSTCNQRKSKAKDSVWNQVDDYER